MRFSMMASLGLQTKGLQTGVKTAQKSVGGLKKTFGGLQRRIAFLVSAGGLMLVARRAIQMGRELDQAAKRSQVLTSEFAALSAIAKDTGAAQETIERSLRNVAQRTEQAAQGNKSYQRALESLGISTAEILQMPVAQRFEAVAAAVANAENKTEAMADASRILGQTAGPKLIQVLEQLGTKGLEPLIEQLSEAGRIPNEETTAALESLDTTAGQLRERFVILAAVVLARIAPAMERMMDFVNRNATAIVNLAGAIAGVIVLKKTAVVVTGSYTVAMIGLKMATLATARAFTVLLTAAKWIVGGSLAIAFGKIAIVVGVVSGLVYGIVRLFGRGKESVDELDGSVKKAKDSTEELSEESKLFGKYMNDAKHVVSEMESELADVGETGVGAFKGINEEMDAFISKLDEAMKGLARREFDEHLMTGAEEEAEGFTQKSKEIVAIAQQHNITLMEAKKIWEQKNAEAERANELSETEAMIQEQKLKLLRLQAAGEKDAADELEARIKKAEEALKISKEHNISLKEALGLVKKTAEAEEDVPPTEDRRSGPGTSDIMKEDVPPTNWGHPDRGISDIIQDVPAGRESDAIREIANQIGAETGRRFQRFSGADGDPMFREMVDGSPGRMFSADEMRQAIDEKLSEDTEETDLLTEIRDSLRGRFVNE